MKPISATHVDSDGLVQPSRQIPAAITAHKFLDNADRIFTQPGSAPKIANGLGRSMTNGKNAAPGVRTTRESEIFRDPPGSGNYISSIGAAQGIELYQISESLTLRRFTNQLGSDSTWRTMEVRHGGSDTVARRFRCVAAARLGEKDERRPAGSAAFGSCGDL
jgi:hypothetical protein